MTTIEQYLDHADPRYWGEAIWGLRRSENALRAVAEMTQRIIDNNPTRFSVDEQDLATRVREEIEEALGIDGKDQT